MYRPLLLRLLALWGSGQARRGCPLVHRAPVGRVDAGGFGVDRLAIGVVSSRPLCRRIRGATLADVRSPGACRLRRCVPRGGRSSGEGHEASSSLRNHVGDAGSRVPGAGASARMRSDEAAISSMSSAEAHPIHLAAGLGRVPVWLARSARASRTGPWPGDTPWKLDGALFGDEEAISLVASLVTRPTIGDPSLLMRAGARRGRLRRCAPRLGAARLRPWACSAAASCSCA